jgi:hypothetical protein
VVKDPAWLSSTVVAALKKVGRRAIIQAGWAGLDTDTLDIPDYIKVTHLAVLFQQAFVRFLGRANRKPPP